MLDQETMPADAGAGDDGIMFDDELDYDEDRPAGLPPARRAAFLCIAVLALLVSAGGAFIAGRAQGSEVSGTAHAGGNICAPGSPGCKLAQPIHEHADFALVINGERFDFGDERFISYDAGRELDPHVHIHDPRHTVVHVHREHISWDYFFRTLGFDLRDLTLPGQERTELTLPDGTVLREGEGGTFKFWVNGVRVKGIGSIDIRAMQRVLISFGPETEEEAMAQLALVTDEACIPGALCPERGSGAGEHGEPCVGQGACTATR